MAQNQGIVVDVPGVGPTHFENEDQATAYFKANPPPKQEPIASNFVVRAPGLVPSAAQTLTENAQKIHGDKRQLKVADQQVDLAKKIQGDSLPKDVIEKMAGYDYAFDLLKQIAETKNRGFTAPGKKGSVVRAPVDTGPLARFIPEGLSSWYARNIEGQTPYDASARARLHQGVMSLINPIRKETTGAQASFQELQNFIAPLMPGMGDNDDPFNSKLIDAATQLANKKRTEINAFRQQGYNVPDSYDMETRMPELMKVVPEKYQVRPPKGQGGS